MSHNSQLPYFRDSSNLSVCQEQSFSSTASLMFHVRPKTWSLFRHSNWPFSSRAPVRSGSGGGSPLPVPAPALPVPLPHLSLPLPNAPPNVLCYLYLSEQGLVRREKVLGSKCHSQSSSNISLSPEPTFSGPRRRTSVGRRKND
jgi:hypothetical protein